MDDHALGRLMRHQSGVVCRRQALHAGLTDAHIERLVRRREWARLLPGVYVDHTGPITPSQRAWAAVLYAAPAALAGRSAMQAHGVRAADEAGRDLVEVVIPSHRRVAPQPWISITRSASFGADVLHHLSPPRVRLEIAVLDVASRRGSEDAAVALLADACQTGRTRADRLLTRLAATNRIRHRSALSEVLVDVSSGAYSALERRYLSRVERAHGLPTGARQRRVVIGSLPCYRDVTYLGLGTHVELDGRLGHDLAADRWADLDRDLASARLGEVTLRAGWAHVLEAHRLAAVVAAVLQARGWTGTPRPCGAECPVAHQRGRSPAPGAGDLP